MIHAFATYDDGTGPALYVGGGFTHIGNIAANGVARYDEATGTFSALGAGVDGYVYALATYQGALYVAGVFTHAGGQTAVGIARWDGTSWTSIGNLGGATSAGLALQVYNAGPAPGLFLGGNFLNINGTPYGHIARWDGSSWSALGTGMTTPVMCLATFTDQNGEGLFAGGYFSSAGGVSIPNRLARWDGQQWSALIGPEAFSASSIYALATYNDGTGTSLYVGGNSTLVINSVLCQDVARWDGSHWHTLAAGVTSSSNINPVQALGTFDDGSGPALYMGGGFSAVNNVSAQNIARWNGTGWSAVNVGLANSSNSAYVAALSPSTSSRNLFVGGLFDTAAGAGSQNIAVWEQPEAVTIDQQPGNTSAPLGGTAVLSVAARGTGVLGYQWRRNGVPLSNGPRIAGAGGAILQINNAEATDVGAYDCEVSNACGTLRTSPVALSVAGCAGDVNGDFRVDLSDLAAVLAAYGSVCD